MGLFNFIKGQFIDVIDCLESSDDNMIWRFPMNGKDIMMNAQLIVRPAQMAVFLNEGQVTDVFGPGTYTLSTQNLPVMTTLRSWKYGFESPFKADVFYVSTRQFTDQRWGTPTPLAIIDPEFGGRILIQSRGQFAYRVSDPVRFLEEYSGTRESCTSQMLLGHIRGFIVQYLRDGIMESGLGYTALNTQLIEFSDKVAQSLSAKFTAMGLELTSFVISEMDLPENLRNAIGKGAEINILGGMQNAATIGLIDAMKTGAANEGNPASAMGSSMAMAAMMGQMFGNINQNIQGSQSGPAAVPSGNTNIHNNAQRQNENEIACSACGSKALSTSKFCPECGKPFVKLDKLCTFCDASISGGAKFCPNCGKSQPS